MQVAAELVTGGHRRSGQPRMQRVACRADMTAIRAQLLVLEPD